MSTLKTHNLQSPDAASVNIALAPNNGMVVAGISTFNNRVLIGTTIEGNADADDFTIGTSTNSAGITIRTNTAGTGRLFFSDGTSGAAEYQGYLQYNHNSQKLSLGSGGATRIIVNSSGDVGISSTVPRARLDVKDANTSHPVILRVSADNATPYALVVGNDDHNTDANNGLAMWVGGSKTHHIQARTSETSSENKLEIEAYETTIQTGSSMNQNFVFDSSGRLLIGTTTAGTGSGDDLTISNSSNMGLTLRSTSSNYCNIYFSDATAGTATYEGYISYNHATDSLEFATSHTERLRIASDGKIGVNTPSPIGTLDVYDGTFVLSKPNASGNERNWRFVNNNVAAGNLGLQVSTAAAGSTFANLVEITKNGYIGINEGTPDRRIHLKDPAQIKLESTGTGNWSGLEFMASSGTNNYDAYMGMNDSNGIFFIDNNSNGHDFTIDRDGRVTTPNTPSFAAYQAQSVWTVSGTMVFNSTRHNVGNHYSTSNGHFTAPVAGSYQFNFYSIYRGNHSSAWVSLYKNNSRMMGGDTHFTSPSLGQDWHNVSFSQVLYLNANDYVEMKSAQSTDWHGNQWQCFSGYLLG